MKTLALIIIMFAVLATSAQADECPPGSGKYCPAGSYCCGADRCCKEEPPPPPQQPPPPPLPQPPDDTCAQDCQDSYRDCLMTAFSWQDTAACNAVLYSCLRHCKK